MRVRCRVHRISVSHHYQYVLFSLLYVDDRSHNGSPFTGGPPASTTTIFALQTGFPLTLASLAWVGTVSVTGADTFTITSATITVTAQATTTLTSAGTPVVIAGGSVRGTFTSTAASVFGITASVPARRVLP